MVKLRIGALDRKLIRDLWEMKGQALAIAAVIAAGVTMFVTYLSNFDSLERTLQTYYERQRFADVFASAVRAPLRLADRIAEIPGVSVVDVRVVADVTLDVPGMTEPATGRLISIPGSERPLLNDVFLRSGNWPDPARPDEVLASEAFAEAHGFVPGDRVGAIINGRRRWLTIVGLALSPHDEMQPQHAPRAFPTGGPGRQPPLAVVCRPPPPAEPLLGCSPVAIAAQR